MKQDTPKVQRFLTRTLSSNGPEFLHPQSNTPEKSNQSLGLLENYRQVCLIRDGATGLELLIPDLNHHCVCLPEQFPFYMILQLFAGFPPDVYHLCWLETAANSGLTDLATCLLLSVIGHQMIEGNLSASLLLKQCDPSVCRAKSFPS